MDEGKKGPAGPSPASIAAGQRRSVGSLEAVGLSD
jgi:hypothetical protein